MLVSAAVILTIVVHPVRAVLSHPYWVDEAWVAVLTKAPLSRLADLSASAPTGFVALLRFVPGTGLQRARLVSLGFTALTTVMAYVLARSLAWASRADARFAGIVAALVVMLVPLSLGRNDLKQYTCDAFCALVLFTVAARAESGQRRVLLWVLAATAVIVIPFSSTSAFVSVAIFAGLLVSALLARNLRRAVEIAAAGVVAAAGIVAYLGVVVIPSLNSQLKAYWASQYLSGSSWHIVEVTGKRINRISSQLAMPLPIFILLLVVGIVVLVKLRAHALALAVPFLWIEMALVGRLRKYPYLDLRTSHFLFIVLFTVIAIGAVGLLQGIARARMFREDAGAVISVVVGGVMAALFIFGFARHVSQLRIPGEDVRAETLAVAERRTEDDVVLVNSAGGFGFSYYWPRAAVVFLPDTSGKGFRSEVAGLPAIYARGRAYPQVLDALRTAVDRWRAAGPRSRLFIVRTHLNRQESAAWHRAFEELGLEPHPDHVGSDPLLVVSPEAG